MSNQCRKEAHARNQISEDETTSVFGFFVPLHGVGWQVWLGSVHCFHMGLWTGGRLTTGYTREEIMVNHLTATLFFVAKWSLKLLKATTFMIFKTLVIKYINTIIQIYLSWLDTPVASFI